MNSHKRIALIPAFEPGPLLNELLKNLTLSGFEIVVVNDGSAANYSYIFEEASNYAVVLTHSENRGKGMALKTGLRYIQKHFGNDYVAVTVDADGQHRAEDAVMLCCTAEHNHGALVLGSRKFTGNVPFRSRFGNMITRLVYRLSTGVKIYDTQTGLRAFHASLLPQLLVVPGDRYEYEMNVLLEFAVKHIPIIEEEIETIYLDNNSASHFDTLKDSYRIYKEILKFSASSLAGFSVDYIMYTFLVIITGNIRLSNIGARIISATVNYTLNRKLVFKSKNRILKSAVSYFLLAAVILFGNTVMLEFLVSRLGIHQMAAKLITEIVFFAMSWLVQRFVVFRKEESS